MNFITNFLLLLIAASSATTTTALITFNIKTSSAATSQSTTTPITSTTPAVFYYVQTTIGTQMVTLLLDSVSHLTWVQARNCTKCFSSSMPNFDPSSSMALPATDPLCAPPLYRGREYCGFSAGNTQGVMARDFFQFRREAPLAFGYVTSDSGSFDIVQGRPTPIIGVLGLGNGHPASIVVQTMEETQGKFSYCLPGNDQDQGLATLEFGGLIPTGGNTTEILAGPRPFYYLFVTGIGLDGQDLSINPTAFLPKSTSVGGGGGFVADPSTPLTLLLPEPYRVVKQAMMESIQHKFGWAPKKANSSSAFDLCYEVDPAVAPYVNFPELALRFHGGAILPLRNTFLTVPGGDPSELCMYVLPLAGAGPNILGGVSQVGTRFFYNVEESVFSFQLDAC